MTKVFLRGRRFDLSWGGPSVRRPSPRSTCVPWYGWWLREGVRGPLGLVQSFFDYPTRGRCVSPWDSLQTPDLGSCDGRRRFTGPALRFGDGGSRP